MDVSFEFLTRAFGRILAEFELVIGIIRWQVTGVFRWLVAIEVLFFSFLVLGKGGVNLYLLLRRLFYIGIVSLLIANFESVAQGIANAASTMSESAGTIHFSFEDPGRIGQIGLQLGNQILLRAKEQKGIFDWGFATFVDYILCVTIMMSYVVLMLYVMTLRLNFALWSSIAFVMLPFSVLPYTQEMGTRGFIGMVNSAISLVAIGIVLAVAFPILTEAQLPVEWTWQDLLAQLAVALLFFFIVFQAGSIARQYHFSVPNASIGSFGASNAVVRRGVLAPATMLATSVKYGNKGYQRVFGGSKNSPPNRNGNGNGFGNGEGNNGQSNERGKQTVVRNEAQEAINVFSSGSGSTTQAFPQTNKGSVVHG